MKKSKSDSGSKRKRRSSSVESKSKRSRARSKSGERERSRTENKAPRKTRWHRSRSSAREDVPKPALPPEDEEKKNKPSQTSVTRIKDLLEDKEKIVEHLFHTISGTEFQELVPEYLKKYSAEDLKKLCLNEIQRMSNETILAVIAGKESSVCGETEAQESVTQDKPEKTSEKCDAPTEDRKHELPENVSQSKSSPDTNENLSSDVLELFATSKEMESIIDEENQVPSVIEEEVARDLRLKGSDAELLELEMRARAIRSLLKARSQAASDQEKDNS
ncbi:hypothetical protein X975_03060, partial [Stegodyphus mimosarum]